MADETEELGLQITGEDLTKGAFASVNASIEGTKEKTSGLSVHTLREVKHMQHGFEQFAQGLASGNIVQAFKGFTTMVITGFREMSGAMAAATLGISLLIAAVVYLAEKWKTEQEKMKKASEEAAKKHEEAWKKALDVQEDGLKKLSELDVKITEGAEDSKVAAMKEGSEKQIALAELTFKKKIAALKAEEKQVQEQAPKMVQYGKWYEGESEKLIKQLQVTAVNAETEKNNKIKEIKEKAAKDEKERAKKEKAEEEKKYKVDLEDYAQNQADINRAAHDAEQERLDNYFAELDREKAYSDMMAAEMVGLFSTLGADIGANIGKGPHEMMKALLTDALSFAEKYVLVQEAAKLSTGWWNPLVWGEIAATAAFFEGAKVAVASFQTPAGFNRTVPGPSNMTVPIFAHGGEDVGRGGGGRQEINLTIHAGDDLSRSLSKSLYFHSKRTGQRIDYTAKRD